MLDNFLQFNKVIFSFQRKLNIVGNDTSYKNKIGSKRNPLSH